MMKKILHNISQRTNLIQEKVPHNISLRTKLGDKKILHNILLRTNLLHEQCPNNQQYFTLRAFRPNSESVIKVISCPVTKLLWSIPPDVLISPPCVAFFAKKLKHKCPLLLSRSAPDGLISPSFAASFAKTAQA